MIHNGIEYGLMAAYAEGLNILHHANAGKERRTADAETTPLRHPEYYQYDLNLADIAEVWRRGSVIASWLLDLTALALLGSQDLADFQGRVSDSGEGRWTVMAAIDESAPAPVISAALYDRFSCAARPISPTRCSQRCVTGSAATWKRLLLPKETTHDRLSFGRVGALRCDGRPRPQDDFDRSQS